MSRYAGRRLVELLDVVSCLLTLPAYYCWNYGLGCYYLTTGEVRRVRDTLVVGPLLLLLALCLVPVAIHGYLLWLLLSLLLPGRPYSLLHLGTSPPPSHQTTFTFATMNVLIGPELGNKFNNLPFVFSRVEKIAAKILDQSSEVMGNALNGEVDEVTKEEAVLTRFPHVDFICFQEVFDRVHAVGLAMRLRALYPYMVVDVATHRPATNLCLLGSGLALASRFPILSATFIPFTAKRGWQWCVDYGVLLCKMDLGEGRVGVLANLHTVAYQGKEQLIRKALTQVEEAIASFTREQVEEGERLEWAVVGGDFNFDNMSPGDRECAEHSLLRTFTDPALVAPGQDAGWAVGTETRQPTLHTPEMRSPERFKDILVDDTRRRHYMLDADVEEQTMDLMTIGPKTNHAGEVRGNLVLAHL